MKRILFIVALFGFLTSDAQKVTGYWYGQANVEIAGIHNNYLTELIIQQKGNEVRGFFGYYFKDIYQSFLVKGSYNPATREVIIKNIPIIYFNTNSTVNSVDCITSFYGTMIASRVKSSLTGYFFRDTKYEYTCPDLRVHFTLYTEDQSQDSLLRTFAASKQFWKSQSANYVSDETEKKVGESESPVLKKEIVDAQTDIPRTTPAVVGAPISPVREDIVKINELFKKRIPIVGKELEISSDSVRLSFYDNGIVDGDSISIFLNNKLVLAHQELTERAFNIYVRMDSLKEINEVSMFAENLGKYPPNTALMVVNDGDNRYEVFMSSDFKGNATVRFRRKKPN
jgi:hypothetical protein